MFPLHNTHIMKTMGIELMHYPHPGVRLGTAWLFIFVLCYLAGCASNQRHHHSATTATIQGVVSSRDRMAVPPNAELEVFLEERSTFRLPPPVIAHTRQKIQGHPPWEFTLHYNPRLIHPGRPYGLYARIVAAGHPLFLNAEPVPVFNNHPTSSVKIMLTHDYNEHLPTKPGATVGLTDARWILTEINGQPAPHGNADKVVNMTLTADGKIHGFAGCNQFMGSYRLDDGRLKIGPLASTRMACERGMELEQQFLKALRNSARFDISEQLLNVLDADGQVMLRFRASRLR